MKTGRNDASGIILAISEFFFVSSFFFWILTNVYGICILQFTTYMIGRVAVT